MLSQTHIAKFAWCCAAAFGLLVVVQQTALAQDAPRPVCVVAADVDTGPVAALGDFSGGMLIGAEKGLFLARAADGKVTVTPVRGDRDAERVLSIQSLPGDVGALIGAWNGVFVAREAGGTISVVAVNPDTGPVFAMRGLAGGVLVGAAEGLFLARQADGKLTVARAGDTDTGRVAYMFEFPGGGVLIAADKGWFLARAESGKLTLAPVVTVAPVTPDRIAPVRSMRGVAGGVLIEGYVWFQAREQDGKLTIALAGDANTGVVDAIGDLSDGALLIHTEEKGWFVGRVEGGRLVGTPAGDAETGRVFQMKRLGSAMLIWARNGLFVARAAGGKVTVAPAGAADTGQAFQMRDFAGGLLISAEKGLFLAREQDGKVTLAPVGADTGPAQAEGIHDLPGGGTLIATSRKRWFFAREAGGKVTLTPAGVADPGRISRMRDFAGGVLIGAERGVFVAAPAGDGARGCEGR